MTTSATTAPALMAFPRYPELPPELRLTVIENTLDSLPEIDKWACDKGDFPMSRYASIDREWNRVVELRLFKDITVFPLEWPIRWTSEVEIQRELVDFGIICGKRSGRVSRVLLRLHDFCHASSENHPHLQILFQVFDLMKDWSLEDREQQGLIELGLDFLRVDVSSSWMDEHILQLGRFPQVPIISSIRELRPEWCSVHLHPCILAALCQKLPSIHHASLTHQSGQSEHISTGDFIRECASHSAESFGPCVSQEWNFANCFRFHGLSKDPSAGPDPFGSQNRLDQTLDTRIHPNAATCHPASERFAIPME